MKDALAPRHMSTTASGLQASEHMTTKHCTGRVPTAHLSSIDVFQGLKTTTKVGVENSTDPGFCNDTRMLVSADGTKIYANAIGDPANQPIVFIHGFAWSLMAFDDIFANPHWTSQFYLVRYDVRGHGRSGKPDTDEAWESKRLAEDFDTVMQAFKLHKPFVAGWSLGASHLMDILSFHPIDHVSGIINIAGATHISESLLLDIGTSFVRDCLERLISSTNVEVFQQAAGDFFDGCCRTLPYDIRQLCLGSIMTQPQEAMRRSLTRSQNQKIFEETGNTSLPCLVIYGDKDELVLVENLPEFYRSWKNVTVEVVEGGSHVPWSDTDKGAAALFNEKMLRWINRVMCNS